MFGSIVGEGIRIEDRSVLQMNSAFMRSNKKLSKTVINFLHLNLSSFPCVSYACVSYALKHCARDPSCVFDVSSFSSLLHLDRRSPEIE